MTVNFQKLIIPVVFCMTVLKLSFLYRYLSKSKISVENVSLKNVFACSRFTCPDHYSLKDFINTIFSWAVYAESNSHRYNFKEAAHLSPLWQRSLNLTAVMRNVPQNAPLCKRCFVQGNEPDSTMNNQSNILWCANLYLKSCVKPMPAASASFMQPHVISFVV